MSFPVFQREANLFPKMERRETSMHILILREFEAVDWGVWPFQVGVIKRTGGFMENIEGMERFRTGSSPCILEMVSLLLPQGEVLLSTQFFCLIRQQEKLLMAR